MYKNRVAQRGFTIVELLIVVVVIAILAAITIVSYAGISQQANNAAIVDGASKSMRMIQAYIAKTGQYPSTVDEFTCITTASGCYRNSATSSPTNATFNSNMATVGSMPSSVPLASSVRGGITYNYKSARTVDGVSAPAILSYYIKGVNSDCGFSALSTEDNAATTLSTRYSVGDVGSSGLTMCYVSIPGPGV